MTVGFLFGDGLDHLCPPRQPLEQRSVLEVTLGTRKGVEHLMHLRQKRGSAWRCAKKQSLLQNCAFLLFLPVIEREQYLQAFSILRR
jgi:hypothetical protein